jgi:serine/threonine-protein kinase
MEQLDFTPLDGTTGAVTPFFSPDGEWIAFWADGQLRRIPVGGGTSVTVAETSMVGSGSWSEDDTLFVSIGEEGIARVPAAGGTLEVVVTPQPGEGETALRAPQLLPGGEWLLVTAFPTQLTFAHSLATGERRTVLSDAVDARYISTGHLLHASRGRLRAVPFDPASLLSTAGPVTLVTDVRQRLGGQYQYDVARDGSLVYLSEFGGGTGGTLGWVGPDGEMEEILKIDEGSPPRNPRLSPDGRRVALGFIGNGALGLYDLDRASLSPFTERTGNYPSWSPDGTVVTFSSGDSGVSTLYQRTADGSGVTSRLTEGDRSAFGSDWAPDGSALVFYDVNTSTGRDIKLLYPDGSRSTFLATEFGEWSPRISPDGRWVAYLSDRSGEARVYLQPFPAGGPVVDVSVGFANEAVWSRDGGQLFFRDATTMQAVEMTGDPERPVGIPRVLFQDPYDRDPLVGNANYDVAPDGRFLMVRGDVEEGGDAPVDQINVVLNWYQELKARVPVP